MGLLCRIFGHAPTDVNTQEFTARCDRCGRGLWVSYDMLYGETIVTGVQPEEKT
jgi:hypothetical protein